MADAVLEKATLRREDAPHGPLPADHPPVRQRRVGVVLMNLGTPDGTDYRSMRRYLSEFLSDRRVIDYSPLFWQPLLQGVILSTRPKKSGAAYRSIWNEDLDESPLRTVTRAQAAKLRAALDRKSEAAIVVDWAMRYGNPPIKSVLERLVSQGCDRILLMALYPQYAAPTTATAYDKAFEALMAMRWQPAIRTLPPYHDHPDYIRLLKDSIERRLAALDWTPDLLVMSYHGLPKRFLMEGDPYHCHCQKTSRLVREALGWPEEKVVVCFQSRFGPEEWLQPYLDKTLESLPGQGTRKIAVISPAFVTDCVETLEEIDKAGRESFLHAGGTHFAYVPCLNDQDDHVAFLAGLARNELGGWV
ncbi:MAG: ferrochelatase [Geminicoccaceae bacterium]|nr:ferrochelatase [Geminicoccaceae bacterium]